MEPDAWKYYIVPIVLVTIIVIVSLIVIIYNIVTYKKEETVREALDKKCPVDPKAGDKINVGNVAPRDHYLFSGCKEVNTCDLPISKIDPISNSIINQTEHCGAWNAVSTGYNYVNPATGWKKA